MAEDFDSEEEKETGTSLRKKLETALSENAELKKVAVTSRAKELIAEMGYKHLTVEDLATVSLSDLEAKAAELELSKAEADAAAVRRVLESRGLTGSDLDAALNGLLGEQDTKAAAERIRQVARLGGTPPSQTEEQGLYGPSRLRAAYAAK